MIIGARLLRAMGSLPSSERPRRVPLSRQPPIWLMVSVVVAALVPLLMQMGHDPVGPAHARADIQPTTRDATTAPAPIRVVEVPARADAAAADEIVSLDTRDLDLEGHAADELEPCPAPCVDEEPDTTKPQHATPGRPDRASQPALLTRATAACRDGDKKTARSTYRALPLGDSRRKEIRKACRREGVWIL